MGQALDTSLLNDWIIIVLYLNNNSFQKEVDTKTVHINSKGRF